MSDIDPGLPRHVAIIMDGNGRWAQARNLLRPAGHRAGVASVRSVVEVSARAGIEVLTLFAFSSENWRRPETEVSLLMELFMTALQREVRKLHKNSVRLRVVGDRGGFSDKLQKRIRTAEEFTAANDGLQLVIAANYGGRWDIVQAARRVAEEVAAGRLAVDEVDEQALASHLCLHELPPPDLFIRTGGEQRVSNFLLWDLAYTELYFTPTLWPDFGESAYQAALEDFFSRQRRFGRTGEQARQFSSSS